MAPVSPVKKPDAKPPPEPKERLEKAEGLLKTDAAAGVTALRAIIETDGKDPELTRVKEAAIGSLTTALADAGDAVGLRELFKTLKPLYVNFAKAKTARIVRTVIDALATIPNTAELQVCTIP
jgi:26S proteasome regulatory subunit N6